MDILSSNLNSPTQIKDRLPSNPTQTIGPEAVGLTNAFCLVYATYEANFLEYLGKFVVEPIDDILILSMLEEVPNFLSLVVPTLSQSENPRITL